MSTSFDLYDYIISIDIGTTFSGSCFSYIKRKKSIVHVIKWPEQKPDDTFEKTPTACLYSTSDLTLLKWGKSAVDHITAQPNDPTVLFIDQFKLKLHTVFQHRRANIPLTLQEKQYWNAAVDYLREIYQYTCHQLIQTVSPQIASENDFRFILTVPATWVEDDNVCMRLIAMEAGLITGSDPNERLVIINEAFAASLFCEREFCIKTEGSTKKLVKGQRYLVCDAGGGTVDLATYECTDTGVEQKGHCQLALESGGCCGSTILDKNMENYLRDQVFLGGVSDVTLKSLVDQFIEEIKHYFGDESGRNNYIAPIITPVKENETINRATTITTKRYTVMRDVRENDYNYEENYLSNSDNEQEDFEQVELYYDEYDVFMDEDIFSDDELIQNLTLTDYVYFTLPAQDENFISFVIESLRLNGNIIRHDKTTQLRIKNTDISKFVFDPVVESVISLVRAQIRKSRTTIKTLFLLGGFGQSSYLYKKLHYEFITCTNAIQHLIVPEDGYRASMRGGIYHGIDCIDIIPKGCIDPNANIKRLIKEPKYEVLVGVDINFFDLTATYSFVRLIGTSILSPNGTFNALMNYKNIKIMNGFFRKFKFDSESFLQYGFEKIFENLTVLTDTSDSIKPPLLWDTCGDTIFYKLLVKEFIYQLYERIQNNYNNIYSYRKQCNDNMQYAVSISPYSTKHPVQAEFNLYTTPMNTLKQELLKKLTELDQILKPEEATKLHNGLCQLFFHKTDFNVEGHLKVLKYHVFHYATEIGMVTEEAAGSPEDMIWIDLIDTYRGNYPYGDIICQEFTSKYTMNTIVSHLKSLPNEIQQNKKFQIITFDLKFFSPEKIELENSEPSSLTPASGPAIFWEFQSLGRDGIRQEIDAGNYEINDMLNHLAGMIDFMGPHVRNYITRRVSADVPSEPHTLSDLFLIPGTEQLMFMRLPLDSTVNQAGLLYAIQRFKYCKIKTEQILNDLIKPWVKYRLASMIKDAYDALTTNPLETSCLFFTGDTILFDNKVVTGPESFYGILRDQLKIAFEKEIYISFGGDEDFARHMACLAHDFNVRNIIRVTEKRYAVHILSHDIRKQENMAQHMYSRLVKKIKAKVPDKKYKKYRRDKSDKNDKRKRREEEEEDECDEIFYTALEGALTLLHPLIDYNIPTSSIIPKYNPFLQFKVPHECSISIVLYASDEVESLNNSVSNNNFKKLHRFIFPIKDVTKPIEISCKVEKYEFVFTVKQDDHEADYRCIDVKLKT